MKYFILQMPVSNNKTFTSEVGDREDYCVIWQDDINISDFNEPLYTQLDEIYRRFNINHPANYAGRSLSVSDIIIFVNTKEDYSRVFVCKPLGWLELNKQDIKDKNF